MRRNQRGYPWNREAKARLEGAWERKWGLPNLIAQHRQVLSARPDELGTRYMLAACLYGDGQRDKARLEWQQVAASEDADWAALAQEALERLSREK